MKKTCMATLILLMVIGPMLTPSASNAAATCTAGVTVPDIKRVGLPFFDDVVVYAVGNGSCPGSSPTGIVVCVMGPQDVCTADANPSGGIAGPAEAQVHCFALTPYYSGAAAYDPVNTPDVTIHGPVTFPLSDCPLLPRITPEP